MTMTLRFQLAVLACLSLLLLTACAGTRGAADQSTIVFRVPGAAATHYTATGRGPAAIVGDQPGAALAAAVETTARVHHATLAGDGRLATLAAFCARALADGAGQVPPEAVQLVAEHLGIYDPSPEVVVIDAPRASAADAVSRELAARLAERPFSHYGAALLARESSSVVVVVLSQRALELEPTARNPDVTEPIRLRGRLPRGIENPRIDLMVGASPRRILAAGAGPDFDVQIPTPVAGVYRIELLGDGERGSSVLARLPIYVGVEPPETFQAVRARRSNVDFAALHRELLAHINEERTRAGLPSLLSDPVLDEVARSHSMDMRDHGFLGHDSPRTAGPADRVERAGLGRSLVLENIVRGKDAASLHASVLAEAGQRSNLLHRDVTHVGLGAVVLQEGQSETLLLTELFVQQHRAVDPALAAPELLALLNETRATRAAEPLVLDPELAAIANEAARAFVNDPSATEQSVVDAANAKLQRFSVTYRRVAALLVLARSLEDARALEPALDATARSVGIGVASGTRADRGGSVLVLALVLAWPR